LIFSGRQQVYLTLLFLCEQFGVTAEEVREKFAEIGDIKTFFDLVEKRAMAFITYVSALLYSSRETP